MDLSSAGFLQEAEPVAEKFIKLANEVASTGNRTTHTVKELNSTASALAQLHQKYFGTASVSNALDKYFELTGKSKPSKAVFVIAQTIDKVNSQSTSTSPQQPLPRNPKRADHLGAAPKSQNIDEKQTPGVEPLVYKTEQTSERHKQAFKTATLVAGKAGIKYSAKAVNSVYTKYKAKKQQAKEVQEQLKLLDLSFNNAPAGITGLVNVEVSDKNILQSLNSIAEKEYMHDMLPQYKKYLASVATVDVMTKYGKQVILDPKLEQEIISVYKKHFGAESNATVSSIIQDFEAKLRKQAPDVYKQIQVETERTREIVKSSILANLKIDKSSLGVAVKDAKDTKEKFVTMAKSASQLTVQAVSKQSVKNLKQFLAQDTSTRSESAIAETTDVHTNKVKQLLILGPDKAVHTAKAVKTTTRTTLKVGKAVIRGTRAAVRMAVSLVRTLVMATINAITSLLAAAAPIVLPVILIVAVFIAIFPMLAYGGTAHLSPDVALNEAYVYYSQFPAKAENTYYQYVYDKLYSIPDKVYKIENEQLEQKEPGFLFVNYDPNQLSYIKNTNPMTFISLLSAYYVEFDFPVFYDEISEQIYDITKGAGLWKGDLNELFLGIKTVEKGKDGTLKKTSDLYEFAINTMDVEIQTATIPTFFYENFWKKASDTLRTYEMLYDALREAYIRKLTIKNVIGNHNYDNLLKTYNGLINSEDFKKFLGPDNDVGFAEIVEKARKEFNDTVDEVFKKIDNTKELINRMGTGATAVVQESGKNFSCECSQFCPEGGEGCTQNCSCNVTGGGSPEQIAAVTALQSKYIADLEQQRIQIEEAKKRVNSLFDELINTFDLPKITEADFNMQEVQTFIEGVNDLWNNQRLIFQSIDEQYRIILNIIGDKFSKPEIKGTIDLLQQDAVMAFSSYLSYPPPSGGGDCCVASYNASLQAYQQGMSSLQSGIQEIQKIPSALIELSNKFQEKLRKQSVVAISSINVDTEYGNILPTDFTEEELATLDGKIMLRLISDNNVAIYILRNILPISLAEKDERVKQARANFVGTYIPYGITLKQSLDIGESNTINEMAFLHHLGYYYDPIVAWAQQKDKKIDALNPKDFPQSFTVTSTNTNYYFTKEDVFCSEPWHWVDSVMTYRGSIMTLNVNENFDPLNPSLIPFDVYVPTFGKMSVQGNTVTIRQEVNKDDPFDQPYEILLVNVNVDYSNFTPAETASLMKGSEIEVGIGQKIGTSEMLYITYINIETRPWLWGLFSQNIRFFQEPSIYYGTVLEEE